MTSSVVSLFNCSPSVYLNSLLKLLTSIYISRVKSYVALNIGNSLYCITLFIYYYFFNTLLLIKIGELKYIWLGKKGLKGSCGKNEGRVGLADWFVLMGCLLPQQIVK
jgi:hypothetical protein